MLTSRVRTVCGATVVALAVYGCGGDSPTGGGGGGGGTPVETTSVAVNDNNSFTPPNIRVSPGATVTWTWAGTTDEDHNINFTNPGILDSQNKRTGTHQAVMPASAGTYTYTCTNHTGMDGSVQVQ